MTITIAILKSAGQVLLREWDSVKGSASNKIIDIDEIKNEFPLILLYPSELETPELLSLLEEENKFYAVAQADRYQLTADSLSSMNLENAKKLLDSVFTPWIMQNNLQTLEQIFTVAHYLKDLWMKDRIQFIQEFWFILKSNLGTSNLRIIFHDLLMASKEGEKHKLVYSSAIGSRIPEVMEGGELEKRLMNNYEKSFDQVFEICEFDKTKGELVLTMKIDNGPLLVMANVHELGPLAHYLIRALVNGLQTA